MKNKKLLIILGCVMSISLMGVGIFSIANTIVDKSYSSREVVVKENTVNEGKEKPKVNTEESTEKVAENQVEDSTEESKPKMELENTEEDAEISKAKAIYDTNNVDEREKEFFGSNYSAYEQVLADIKDKSDNIFSELSIDFYAPIEEEGKIYGVGEPSINFADVAEFDSLSIYGDALTVICMYDNTRLICAYNYPRNSEKSLLCIDLSDYEFPVDSATIYDYGRTVDFFIYPKQGRLEYIDGWSVLFVKG